MRKVVEIVYCDKCKKEMPVVEAALETTLHLYDLCFECNEAALNLLDDWINKDDIEDEADYEEDDDECEGFELFSNDEEEEEPEAEEPKRKYVKQDIDWGKACALKNAGWRHKDIAAEVGTTEANINGRIYKELAKRRS